MLRIFISISLFFGALLTHAPQARENLSVTAQLKKRNIVFPANDWVAAAPESQGIDAVKLADAINHLAEKFKDHGGISETVIIRNGHLIWQGSNIDRKHRIWSATKSMVSTALGILIDDGKCTLDTRAADYAPELKALYGEVTLRHFATMTSGFDAEGGRYDKDPSDKLDGQPFPLKPTSPLFPPGQKFRYWDDAMNQFGLAVGYIAKEPVDSFFIRRVAAPIGIKNFSWNHQKFGTEEAGIHTTARELARFGHPFLNRGDWNGKRIVSSAWVEQATRVQVPASLPFDAFSPRQHGSGVYGFNWWVNGVTPEGKRLWPRAPVGTYVASGASENRCFVIPEWNMVVVRMGTDGRPDNINEVWDIFFGKLAAAIKE